jgi:hypothetical protein
MKNKASNNEDSSSSPFSNKLITSKLKQSKTQELDNSSSMENYRNLLDKVTDKIDSWHRSITQKSKGRFTKDSDFIDLQASPSKFQSE